MSEPDSKQEPSIPGGRVLAAITAVGAASALWALFQWGQLLVARAGGATFCSIDTTFDCRAVWDSAFASTIHNATGLPVAGWGLCWGLAAMSLPLWALANQADKRTAATQWIATVVLAIGGLASIVVMATLSLSEGKVCPTCLATYALVATYAGLSLWHWRAGRPSLLHKQALLAAGSVVVVAYLVLLIPGQRTPSATNEAATLALDAAAERARVTPTESATASTESATTPTTADDPVAEFLTGLPPQLRQGVSDALGLMQRAPAVARQKPRSLHGSPNALLLITEFTDVLCSHCAELYSTLTKLQSMLPPDTIAVESRFFPLDSGCNSALNSPPQHPVRCLGAKAQICLESHPRAFEYAGALFENQRHLTEDEVYKLAAPYMATAALKACIESPTTGAKLVDDIAWAMQHDIDGTPLVLINGKKAAGLGPFLYALALAKGDPNHPAFKALPPARADAHMH